MVSGKKQIALVDIGGAKKGSMKQILDYYNEQRNTQAAFVAGENGYITEIILHCDPDVVILNLGIQIETGIALIEGICKMNPMIAGRLIVMVEPIEASDMNRLRSMGVLYIMLQPVEEACLSVLVEQVVRNKELHQKVRDTQPNETQKDVIGIHHFGAMYGNNEVRMDTVVTDIIRELGIPVQVKGYQYIREGILMAIDNMDVLNYVTKLLYPTIAQKYHTTPSSVERAIRHAIEVSWDRGNMKSLDEKYRCSSQSQGKPTNSEFIALIADKLQLTYGRKMA